MSTCVRGHQLVRHLCQARRHHAQGQPAGQVNRGRKPQKGISDRNNSVIFGGLFIFLIFSVNIPYYQPHCILSRHLLLIFIFSVIYKAKCRIVPYLISCTIIIVLNNILVSILKYY